MSSNGSTVTRRTVLASLAAASCQLLSGARIANAAPGTILKRAIPSTGEMIPAVGMGTWITFNVGADTALRDQRAKVLQSFFEHGGTMVDSSPMYGSAEEVIGYCLKRVPDPSPLFSATKVWTMTGLLGRRQMKKSEALWGENQFDLMQIHNLLDWETHLDTLKAWKAEKRIRYLGITTSHGRRHDDIADIMANQPIDFVQFTYNIVDREAEARLLPLAADKGRAVIINRPFQRGALFERVKGHPLPGWASEIDVENWAQFLLKFVVSHPAVTCAIPATSKVDHMLENMGALRGRMPDSKMRQRMISHFESL